MMKPLLLMILLCAGVLRTSAQTVVLQTLDRGQYQVRVKTVEEFFARFNGEEKRGDMPEEYTDRVSEIMLLFDLSKFESKSDSGYVAAREFANRVVSDSPLLKYEDTDWFAKIKCHGIFERKKVDFYLFLRVEERDSAMYRWAVSNVEGSLFRTSRDIRHKEFFIMPNDNEQFFQSVPGITRDKYRYIDDFIAKEYKADALSTFLALVRSNQLKIEAVSNVSFVFLQVPGYMFTVKYFERNNNNVGWLIDSCEPITEQEKKILLKKIHL